MGVIAGIGIAVSGGFGSFLLAVRDFWEVWLGQIGQGSLVFRGSCGRYVGRERWFWVIFGSVGAYGVGKANRTLWVDRKTFENFTLSPSRQC